MASELDGAEIERFRRTLERLTGLPVASERAYLAEGRLRERAAALGRAADHAALCELLMADPTARIAVTHAIAAGTTAFFREPQALAAAAAAVGGVRNGRAPVVWSLGCGTGQEVYSLLIALAEAGVAPAAVDLRAIDISAAALARAVGGAYSAFEVSRGLTCERLAAWFEPAGPGWRVVAPLRSRPTWSRRSVLDGLADLPRPDVVLCIDLLPAFTPATRAVLLTAIGAALQPGGLLFLGADEAAEPAGLAGGRLVPVPALAPGTYRRRRSRRA